MAGIVESLGRTIYDLVEQKILVFCNAPLRECQLIVVIGGLVFLF